ncbi:hypothetical protein LAZ67_12001971 [Cordylochernes scorpioides]|uniref:Uncharacterized protein n=1 Tax=Cordylochernes scorpioides TaxID=51811 RepID=A0ABY6L503_9ARAC|nr:hypothetical protein LAZ67_12001971 [Cordylochernes scorpioides]
MNRKTNNDEIEMKGRKEMEIDRENCRKMRRDVEREGIEKNWKTVGGYDQTIKPTKLLLIRGNGEVSASSVMPRKGRGRLTPLTARRANMTRCRNKTTIAISPVYFFTNDLCDGTRMVFQRMCSHVLEAHILTVPKVEHTV